MNIESNKLYSLPELKFDKNRNRVKFCPCGKDNKDYKFVPYIGFENNGYCHSCGETFLPELYKNVANKQFQLPRSKKLNLPSQKKIDFISESIFRLQLSSSINLYIENHFIQWLFNPYRAEFAFDIKTISMLIGNYFLGNSIKYKGWILFPYIDINGNIMDIKAIDYNPATGKRIAIKNGDKQNRCHFIGKEILNNPDANTERCFYGEHLLKGNTKLVRVFESEATATYSAPFYPDSVCIATGGNNGCKWTEKSKCRVLEGRCVILYPDIDAHDSWEEKAEILRRYGITVHVSQLIKTSAIKFAEQMGVDFSELVKLKFDMRDILQNKKLSDFLNTDPIITTTPNTEVPKWDEFELEPFTINYQPENWDQEILELVNYFAQMELPTTPIKLNQCSIVLDCAMFIESHLSIVKRNNGKVAFSPYLERLRILKAIM